MTGPFEHGLHAGAARLSTAIGSFAENLRLAAQERIDFLSASWRTEVRRVATALALSLALAFFICAAAAFAMFAFMLSFWETHRILAAWLAAAGFAALAWLVVILLRRATDAGGSTGR